jgi:hypothetical protein
MEKSIASSAGLKLFMVLLGSKAPGRNVEQHDFFFGIGNSLKDLVPQMRAFWNEAGASLHVDGWREINAVDGFDIQVVPQVADLTHQEAKEEAGVAKLFFINLGGYQAGKFEEQHYILLSVKPDIAQAIQAAKRSIFFKNNSMKGANAHIDDKYGIDIDDIHQIEDLLSPALKAQYKIVIKPGLGLPEEPLNLGYFKLDKL